MDEFDIEVTDLREQKAKTITAGNHTDPNDLTASHSISRVPLGKRLVRRQRLVRALAVVLTILLALALILGANPTTRAALDALLHPETIFANSTASGSEQFDLVHIAPWGDLRIDGQTVPKKQVLQRFRAITLAPGTHTLDYSAPPFSPLHCVLTVPADHTTDTCPLTQNADDLYPVQSDNVRMLDLRAGFTNVSGQQLAALTTVAGAGLLAASPTAYLDFGEHYLTATHEVAVNRSRPIRATLVYSLNTKPPQMLPGSPSPHCSPLCTEPPQVLPGFPPLHCSPLCFYPHLIEQAPGEWGVLAPVTLSWSYVITHGSAVDGPVTPDHDTMDAGVALHITWQHGWRVTPLTHTSGPFGNPICLPAQQALAQATVGTSISSTSALRPAPAAEGCVIEWIGLNPATNTYTPASYLLYRFGVLLAANNQAHRTFPTLPLADASEQALAASQG